MYWTAFHQLYCVVTTYRPPASGSGDWSDSDREQYAYDGSGHRVRKYAGSVANGNWNYVDTRYLPGLELRGNTASGENLAVIVLDDGARVLNWAGGAGKPSDIPNLQLRYQYSDRQGSCQIETDKDGNVITQEEYYPYGGTAVLASRSNSEVKYKYIRYCGKERDATGLFYYGLRYYQPWIGRWINPDPAGTVNGQNLYRMVRNNPVSLQDRAGLMGDTPDPTQGQARATAPKPPRLPQSPSYETPRHPEIFVDLEKKGLINEDAQGRVNLDLSQRGVTEPDLWHYWDKQFREKVSVYREGLSEKGLHPSFVSRKNTLGFTVIQTFQGKSRLGLKVRRTAVGYLLAPVTVFGKIVNPTLRHYKLTVLPLLNPINGKPNYPDVAKFSYEHPEKAQTLARAAMLNLVATRTVDEMGLKRGTGSDQSTSAREIFKTAKNKVMADLEGRIEQLHLKEDQEGFYEGQEFLYRYLDVETRKELIGGLPGPSSLASPTRTDSDNPMQDANPAMDAALLSHHGGPPSASEALDPIAESGDYAWGHQTQLMQPYLHGGPYPYAPYPHDPFAAGPSQAPGPSHIFWQGTMPAQDDPPLLAAWHEQPLPQQQQPLQPFGQRGSYPGTPSAFFGIDPTIPHGAPTVEEIIPAEAYQQQPYQYGHPYDYREM
nr:RHS repeat-associated core domain-containing protein [Bordetella sp. LUAb4]